METDFNKQAVNLVAAIPTDSQGDGRKFADAVRKSLNYMATDFDAQAARLVAAIPTDSQGDGRKFADAVRKSLNYIATHANSGGGGGTAVTTISNQLSNVKISYAKSGDYYNLTVTWGAGNFNDTHAYKYALLNLQQAPQKGNKSVDWNKVGSRIYQSKDGALTTTITNVLPGYLYRVVAIGVTKDGQRSEEKKAPSAVTFIPVQVRDTTPPVSLTTTATSKGLLIEWKQRADAFYTYTELRDNNSNFGVDSGLLTRSRGLSYMYIPKERNGTIYAANFGISGEYSSSISSTYSFPQLITPEAPQVTVNTDDNEDQYKITVTFKAPTYGLGTNVYVNNAKFVVDYSQHSFTYYTTKEHDVISLTYFDCVGESNRSTPVTVDVSNPRHSDLNTFIDIHSNNITSQSLTTNVIDAKNIVGNTISVDSLTIDDSIKADAIEANQIKTDTLSSKGGSILDFTANTINAVDATIGTADVNTLTYMNMSPTDGANGVITANRIVSNGKISTTGEVDANEIVFTVSDNKTENPSIGKEEWLSNGKDTYGLVLRGKTTYFNGVGKDNKAWINNETGDARFKGGVTIDGSITVNGNVNSNGVVHGSGGLDTRYNRSGYNQFASSVNSSNYSGEGRIGADPAFKVARKNGNGNQPLYYVKFTPMFSNGSYNLADVIRTLLANSVRATLVQNGTSWQCNCNCCDGCGDDAGY